MITVYPSENWNSFADIATADIKLAEIGNTDWATSTKKEELLIKSANYIKAYFIVKDNKCPYIEAQMALINLDMVNGGVLLGGVIDKPKYKKAKVGSLDVTYRDDESKNDGSNIPLMVRAILSDCLKGQVKVTKFSY